MIKSKIFSSKKTRKNITFFFLDPPFADKEFIINLSLIYKNKIYKKKHIIIIHRERNTNDALSYPFETLITKQYGRSKIIFGIFN